ncbi:MAG: Hsp20/alpha crystallin family protein [Chthoniobacter sp.]|uniref:Hsp20/alpha crystallin family protein n=1 Tax=Chthoniobacter sp. TaxID=2510640 RepID=UPI0032A2AE51
MSIIRYQLPQLSRWSSFDRFSSLRDEVNRLFELPRQSRDRSPFSGWTPALDVFDEKDNLVVTVELPGLKKDEINLSLHDGILTISGERKRETEKKEGETFRSERYFGKFQRSVTLPATVDSSKVNASYKDGILAVTLPKAEEAKPKQIAISLS